MAGYDQNIKIKARFEKESRHFFRFLQQVGKRYSHPIKIKYQYLKRGRFYVIVDGGSGGIDALFQELIINKGLYYYSCSLYNKKDIIRNVIVPIFRQLIDCRFENSQSRFLAKHVLGKRSQNDFVPSDIKNKHGYKFEILFRKWDINSISNREYIIELDALLTNFMLNKLNHKIGDHSPNFNVLIRRFTSVYVIFSDIKATFNRVHQLRVDALHKLNDPNRARQIEGLSNNLFRYFTYIDELEESRKDKTIKSGNKRYRRIKYGEEIFSDGNGVVVSWAGIAKKFPCGDCGVKEGWLHVSGCDIEQCPKCKGQALGCRHR